MTETVTDAALLDRFVTRREEAAFVELVRRHRPLVLKVCRRFLPSEHDVEDVFQATFLVLAVKAGDISWNESVGGWLHSVARRLALNARAGASRRRSRERPIVAGGVVGSESGSLPDEWHPLVDPLLEIERRDLSRVLDDALHQLPEKYRAPVVLCYLEGKTNEEAARELGWPAGSMSRRLERARSLLRARLAHAGVVLVLAIFCGTLALTRTGSVGPGDPRETGPVRQAMRMLEAPTGGQLDLQAVLDSIDRGDKDPDREQFDELARKAQWVADQVAEHHPGVRRGEWRDRTARMRQAAMDLALAARTDDRTAMLAAARRLDATCIGCHEAFRPRRALSPVSGFMTPWLLFSGSDCGSVRLSPQ
jgi:RNA polymerase sigma-70 factor (ECF subfamily)